jgi:hypothetical protein
MSVPPIVLVPAPRAEAVLFSYVQREIRGGGEALGEGLLILAEARPCLELRIAARAGVRRESFAIIAA